MFGKGQAIWSTHTYYIAFVSWELCLESWPAFEIELDRYGLSCLQRREKRILYWNMSIYENNWLDLSIALEYLRRFNVLFKLFEQFHYGPAN